MVGTDALEKEALEEIRKLTQEREVLEEIRKLRATDPIFLLLAEHNDPSAPQKQVALQVGGMVR